MRVKKFEAKSMKEALQMVKQELGPDAVILSARDNRKSFGLGGDASVEITAAVSEGTLSRKRFAESRLQGEQRATFNGANARQQKQFIDQMVDKRERRDAAEAKAAQPRKAITSMSYIDIPDDVEESPRRSNAFERAAGRKVDDLLQDFNQPLKTEAPTGDRAMARIRNAAREAFANNPFIEDAPRARVQQLRNDSDAQKRAKVADQLRSVTPSGSYSRATTAHAVAQAAAQQARSEESPRANARSTTGLEIVPDYEFDQPETFKQVSVAAQGQPTNAQEVSKLKGEIQRLEQMLEGFHKVPQTFASLHPGADYGIGYDFSFMFQKLQEAGISVENAVEILKQAAQEIDPSQAKKRPIIDAWVARWLLNNTKVAPTPFQGRLHLFVGGAGSGKTTSLVKMAAHLVVKEKKTIAVLSVDSTKVGAIDQMKIYCQILNVPFAVIRNKQDWEWVMSQLRHVDHILVDYPGLNLRDLEEIHHLKTLLPPDSLAATTHLCVSATSKDGDADELARRYKVTNPQDLIFTNLDQSVQHGLIYNLQRKTGLPLHSFGIGNRIPEDFELASKERVLDLIFKITKLRRETA